MKTVISATLVAFLGFVSPVAAQQASREAPPAPQYKLSVVASGLQKPTGLAIRGSDELYFTELPTPGVAGPAGGQNRVSRLDLESGDIENITTGEPEPTNLAIGSGGDVYWTCKSAGVILRLMEEGGVDALALQQGTAQGDGRCGAGADDHQLFWSQLAQGRGQPGDAGAGQGSRLVSGVRGGLRGNVGLRAGDPGGGLAGQGVREGLASGEALDGGAAVAEQDPAGTVPIYQGGDDLLRRQGVQPQGP